jgi:hypothetical protein
MHVQIFIENEGWDRSTGPTAFDYHLKVVKSKIGKDNLVLCNGYAAHNLVLCNGYDAHNLVLCNGYDAHNLVLCNGYDAHNLVLCNGYDAHIFINLQKSA